MNQKGFFNILLSTTITLLILSALLFYILSDPKESLRMGGKTIKAIADTSAEKFQRNNSSNLSISPSSQTSQQKIEDSISIVGRDIDN